MEFLKHNFNAVNLNHKIFNDYTKLKMQIKFDLYYEIEWNGIQCFTMHNESPIVYLSINSK